ncbi:MAG: hypothetical protein AAES65_14905 [Candidatus Thiodiazotropha sp. (ex. Lucinoma kazani)]|nr:hypothetical protein [Candidatus Thiodiazotropha sp. (ex Lucinoma borealis)]
MQSILHKTVSLLFLLLLSNTLWAEPRTYPRPVEPLYQKGDEQLSCRQLEQQLSHFESQSYSDKPGFYEDPYTGASIWIGALWVPGALSYLGYSGIAEYHENDRIHHAQSRIDALRRMKANLRCHEY